MSEIRRINQAALDLVCYYEGLYLNAYKDSVGVVTIGLGRIRYSDGSLVKMGDTCTREQAQGWLQEDLEEDGGQYVRKWCKPKLTDNQYGALVSFTFNRGAGRLKQLVGMPGRIEDNFLKFGWAGKPPKTLLGLQRRRRSERALYRGEDWEDYTNWRPTSKDPG